MSAVTSPIRAWHTLISKLPLASMLTFLLATLPLTALSIYALPYSEYPIAKFIWMVFLLLVVLLTQVRASMNHPNNRYLNSLTSLPITFVSLPTVFAGSLAFSKYSTVVQSSTALLLILSTISYAVYALLRNRQETAIYRLLTRRGSALLQFFILFVLVMTVASLLPNPARAQQEASRHGPAAPWQTQLAVAQERALSVNKDAVLVHITASTTYVLNEDYTTTLNTRFYYVDAAGPQFKVAFDDINPAETVEVEPVTSLDNMAIVKAYPVAKARSLQSQYSQSN